MGRQMPFTMFAFLIGSLSIIGLPPFAGAWSKWYLVLGAMEAHHYVVTGILLVSSLLNIYYLLPIVVNAFFASAPKDDHHHEGLHEAPILCVIPLLFTATGCLVLFFFPDPVLDLLKLIGGSGP
ncbi:MAG: multicomponent Na+:H+ antiporter subunit D [Candidatus Latescibacterota bacterium]